MMIKLALHLDGSTWRVVDPETAAYACVYDNDFQRAIATMLRSRARDLVGLANTYQPDHCVEIRPR